MVFLIHICLVPKARLFLQWWSVTLLSGTISHFLFILLPPFQCLKCFVKEAEWSGMAPTGSTEARSLLSWHSVQVEKQFHNSQGSATSSCFSSNRSLILSPLKGGESLFSHFESSMYMKADTGCSTRSLREWCVSFHCGNPLLCSAGRRLRYCSC